MMLHALFTWSLLNYRSYYVIIMSWMFVDWVFVMGMCCLGCTDETKKECLEGLVFGLPARHWEYLQHVKSGLVNDLYLPVCQLVIGRHSISSITPHVHCMESSVP